MRKIGMIFLTLSLTTLLTTACTQSLLGKVTPTATVKPKVATQTAAAAAAVMTGLASPTMISPTSTSTPIASPSTLIASPFMSPVATSLPPQLLTPAPQPLTPGPQSGFCSDPQATALIDNFKTALQTSDGAMLASLVSPDYGMDARLYRDGRVVRYDQEHAQYLFTSTFPVDWGAAPGSGLETIGSFHELILPALMDVFNKNYTLACDQVQVGGTTYQAEWPYTGVDFVSVYFPGTQGNGSMDWHTWLIGMHYVNGTPFLHAIMQFTSEP